MSHAFGDLLAQYRARQPGLNHARLAELAGYDPSLVGKLAQGRKELTGPSGRERVVRLVSVLRDQGALTTLGEANALLAAARMPPLYSGSPDEAALIQALRPAQLATFGEFLRSLRHRMQMTQEELGITLGYSAAMVAQLESGERQPNLGLVKTRFIEALALKHDPEAAARLVELAAAARAGAPLDSSAEAPAEQPRHQIPNNLPVQLTHFIGRQHEIAEVAGLLGGGGPHLLTLTGAGGVGKTRLAIEVGAAFVEAVGATGIGATGRSSRPSFPGGVWLVDLAPLADGALVSQAVVSALNLPEQPGRAPLDLLRSFLARKHLLLILDNCEHLLDACADLTQQLLSTCPHLYLLATSRETLRIPGEVTWRVPSLSTPDPANLPPLQQVLDFEAIALFIDRAAAAQPGFTLTPSNVTATAQICQRLDGIPLAIELAASRINGLSVAEIASRLDDRFHLLARGSRTALPRHQTLHTLIDWSYGLLSGPERNLLERLSVFAGGWALDMAEAVCADKPKAPVVLRVPDALPLLLELVNKSLVVVDERQGGLHACETRYHLLETIRVFALEKLAQRGEVNAMRRKHAEAHLALAKQAISHFHTKDEKEWFDRIVRERDNIRAALAWSQTARGDTMIGLRLAGALWRFWRWHGPASEGRRWFTELIHAIKPDTPPEVRAQVLLGAAAVMTIEVRREEHPRIAAWLDEALSLFHSLGDQEGMAYTMFIRGYLAVNQREYVGSQFILEQTLDVSRQLAHPWLTIAILRNLAILARNQGNFTRATTLLEEGLAMAHKVEDRYSFGEVLNALADVAFYQLDFKAARELAQQGLRAARQAGNTVFERIAVIQIGESSRFLGDLQQARASFEELLTLSRAMEDESGVEGALHFLGKVAYDEGHYQEAYDLFVESLTKGRTNDDQVTPFSLEWLATVAAGLGQPIRAARLFGAGEALREAQRQPVPPDNVAEYERHVATVRAQLDQIGFTAAWAEGRTMTLEQAVAYALQSGEVDGPTMR